MGWNTRPPQALLGWAGALPEVSGERSRPFVFITSEVPRKREIRMLGRIHGFTHSGLMAV